ncbi:YciI family protein [Gammaproteobacteria bacterium]|nr:YciI family protein [Gammaproteobacteria bacterium]
MKYFTWGINKPGTTEQRTSLIRNHWDFIEKYNNNLIARGPVMNELDFSVVIGSIHIVELKNLTEAEEFAYNEPFAKAGLFKSILINPFKLELKRTQFDFSSNPDFSRFFLYCPATTNAEKLNPELIGAHKIYCEKFDENFICHGSLLNKHSSWQGHVYFLEFSTKLDFDKFLDGEPFAKSDIYDKMEVYRWTMGGPENLNSAGTLS